MPAIKVIRDQTSLKKELSAAFWECRRGRLDPKSLNALSVAANVLLAVMEAERRHQDGREASPLLLLAAEFAHARRAAGLAEDEVGGLSPEVAERLAIQADQDPTPHVIEQEQDQDPEAVPRPRKHRLPQRLRNALAA